MDLQKMDLNYLVILWKTSGGNPILKEKIELELQNRIQTNTNFSREHFFEVCKMKSHAITVSFIPTSDAYNTYGPDLTIDIILNDEELQEMVNNCTAKPVNNTQGNIKARVLVKNDLSASQIAMAAQIGFFTNEVYETLHV